MKKFLGLFLSIIVISNIFYSKSFAKVSMQNELLFSSYEAPEIVEIEKWFNSNPIKLSNLKGKVVLVEFWTYSCINCIRGIPYINKIYDKYSKADFEIIGLHSPEFEYEKNPENVAKAIKKYQIKYPVALDNKEQNWDNYKNKYWPAYYLINKEGKVVYTSFGEGGYDILENNIRYLLNS